MEPIQHASLYAALAAAQGEFTDAAFDRQNPHLKNRYATLASVLASVRPVLSRHGLCVIQAPSYADGVVKVMTTLAHTTGGAVTMELGAPLDAGKGMSIVQVIGSAITYLRRYSLMAALGITSVEDDDDGASAPPASTREPKKAAPPLKEDPTKAPHDPSWEADRARFCAKISEIGYEYDQVAAWVARVGKTGLRPSQMPQAGRDAVYAMLDKQRPDLGGPGKAD